MGFEDPTPADKQAEFAMCGALCGSGLHDEAADKGEDLSHLTYPLLFVISSEYSSDVILMASKIGTKVHIIYKSNQILRIAC